MGENEMLFYGFLKDYTSIFCGKVIRNKLLVKVVFHILYILKTYLDHFFKINDSPSCLRFKMLLYEPCWSPDPIT